MRDVVHLVVVEVCADRGLEAVVKMMMATPKNHVVELVQSPAFVHNLEYDGVSDDIWPAERRTTLSLEVWNVLGDWCRLLVGSLDVSVPDTNLGAGHVCSLVPTSKDVLPILVAVPALDKRAFNKALEVELFEEILSCILWCNRDGLSPEMAG